MSNKTDQLTREFYHLGAREAVGAIAEGLLSCEDLVRSCINRVKELEPTLRAWVCFDGDKAIEQARERDLELKQGKERGLLCGIPVGVKDIFNTHDMPTCMGSPIWKGFMPGNDARVVTNLRRAGAVIPGKTVTAEFAVHHPGPTQNPYSFEHITGTSSSGSAVAVATGMVPVALGTQTAGSTLRPASFCGIYGYKPSFALVPRTGVLKTLDTLDHVTWFARNVPDLQLMLDCLRVRGENYPYVHAKMDLAPTPTPERVWNVGFVRTPVWDQAENYTQKAMLDFVKKLQAEGIHVREVELPSRLSQAHQVHATIYKKALSYYFKDEYTQHKDLISEVMKEMIAEGQKISMEEYHSKLDEQNSLARELDDFLKDFDIVLSHTTASQAPLLGITEKPDPCLMWTLCRVPVLGVPLFKGPDGLPFGAQLISRRYDDDQLLAFGNFLRAKGMILDSEVVGIKN